MTMRISVPGRVNLIGDHVDYTGGLVLPMAVDMRTTITCETAPHIDLVSADDPDPCHIELPLGDSVVSEPRWARYVAAVAHEMNESCRVPGGIRGTVTTQLPVGAGLSSSAALEIATALALGFEGTPLDLALLCQRAEHRATGVPTGLMDQLSIASAKLNSATLIDCASQDVTHVSLPTDVAWIVVFVAHRTLEGSPYADRVTQCARAADIVGPLRHAQLTDLSRIDDDIVRARARHVITENSRVLEFVEAISAGDFVHAGALMNDSHRSLAEDYDVSTPQVDDTVRALQETPGVFGARLTGGGFGGCVVAMVDARRNFAPDTTKAGWRVSPAAGPVVTRHV